MFNSKVSFIVFVFVITISSFSIFSTENDSLYQAKKQLNEKYNVYLEAEKRGDYRNALQDAKEVLAMGEMIYGEISPQTAVYSNNLADLYNTKGNYKKAIEFYNTPEGKSIAQKAPKISQEMMFASQQWAQDANERVMLLMQATNK